MTPIDYAQMLATGETLDERAEGVAMIARGLSDPDPVTLRQGWLMATAVEAAARYLDLEPTPELLRRAEEIAPTIPDWQLNKGAAHGR